MGAEELSKIARDSSKEKFDIFLDNSQGTCLYFFFWLVLGLFSILS